MPAPVPSVSDFTDRYAEFGEVPAEYANQLELFLNQAARFTNAKMYATEAACADAVMLKAAVLAHQSPYARKMRLVGGEQAERYRYELYLMQRSATMGYRVW